MRHTTIVSTLVLAALAGPQPAEADDTYVAGGFGPVRLTDGKEGIQPAGERAREIVRGVHFDSGQCRNTGIVTGASLCIEAQIRTPRAKPAIGFDLRQRIRCTSAAKPDQLAIPYISLREAGRAEVSWRLIVRFTFNGWSGGIVFPKGELLPRAGTQTGRGEATYHGQFDTPDFELYRRVLVGDQISFAPPTPREQERGTTSNFCPAVGAEPREIIFKPDSHPLPPPLPAGVTKCQRIVTLVTAPANAVVEDQTFEGPDAGGCLAMLTPINLAASGKLTTEITFISDAPSAATTLSETPMSTPPPKRPLRKGPVIPPVRTGTEEALDAPPASCGRPTNFKARSKFAGGNGCPTK